VWPRVSPTRPRRCPEGPSVHPPGDSESRVRRCLCERRRSPRRGRATSCDAHSCCAPGPIPTGRQCSSRSARSMASSEPTGPRNPDSGRHLCTRLSRGARFRTLNRQGSS
jgi:hypothetical protein